MFFCQTYFYFYFIFIVYCNCVIKNQCTDYARNGSTIGNKIYLSIYTQFKLLYKMYMLKIQSELIRVCFFWDKFNYNVSIMSPCFFFYIYDLRDITRLSFQDISENLSRDIPHILFRRVIHWRQQ